jgi:hypothetical protein
MFTSTSTPLWKRRGIQSPVHFDTSQTALDEKRQRSRPKRRKKIYMQGKFRDCKHYMGSYMDCNSNLDVEEHLDLVHPATRARVKERIEKLGRFLGDAVSSEDIRSFSFY